MMGTELARMFVILFFGVILGMQLASIVKWRMGSFTPPYNRREVVFCPVGCTIGIVHEWFSKRKALRIAEEFEWQFGFLPYPDRPANIEKVRKVLQDIVQIQKRYTAMPQGYQADNNYDVCGVIYDMCENARLGERNLATFRYLVALARSAGFTIDEHMEDYGLYD